MAKKLFTIERKATIYMQIEVAAETAKEAEELAKERFENIPLSEYSLESENIRNCGSVDFELNDHMVYMAKESIQQEVEHNGGAVLFEPVEVHYDLLEFTHGGREAETIEHTISVDSAYVDEDFCLWVRDEWEEHEDLCVSDLDDVDQEKIIKAILSRK